MRTRAIIAAALLVSAASCLQATPPQPSSPPATESPAPAGLGGATSCPLPRAPSYLPWGPVTTFPVTRGPVTSLRSDAPPSYFVLERRADLVGAPTAVTAPQYGIYGRSTYLLWSSTPGASEMSAWWEEGTGDCRIYHARLALSGEPAAVEAQFVKIIASIPAAFIDASSGKTGLLAEIPLEHVPSSLAVLPLEDRLFVADRDGGLSAFNTTTNALVKRTTLPLIDRLVPEKITAVPSTKRIYVTDFAGDRVLVIDGTTLDLVATVAVGRAPVAIASDATANRIYVANLGYQSARSFESVPGSITVIDGQTNNVVATVATKGHPVTIDVASTGRVYVGALASSPGESSFIQVVDARTNREVASVGTSPPSMILADPVDNAVYALSTFAHTAPSDAKFIGSKWIELDTRTNGAATFVDGPGDARAMGWHSGNDRRYRHVYVASQRDIGGVLTFYQPNLGWTRLSRSAAELRVGSEPVAIAVDSTTHRVYVASAGSKLISVVLQGPG